MIRNSTLGLAALLALAAPARAQWQMKQTVDPMTDDTTTFAFATDSAEQVWAVMTCWSGKVAFTLETRRNTDWLYSSVGYSVTVQVRAGTERPWRVLMSRDRGSMLHNAYLKGRDAEDMFALFDGRYGGPVLLDIPLIGNSPGRLIVSLEPDSAAVAAVTAACKRGGR